MALEFFLETRANFDLIGAFTAGHRYDVLELDGNATAYVVDAGGAVVPFRLVQSVFTGQLLATLPTERDTFASGLTATGCDAILSTATATGVDTALGNASTSGADNFANRFSATGIGILLGNASGTDINTFVAGAGVTGSNHIIDTAGQTNFDARVETVSDASFKTAAENNVQVNDGRSSSQTLDLDTLFARDSKLAIVNQAAADLTNAPAGLTGTLQMMVIHTDYYDATYGRQVFEYSDTGGVQQVWKRHRRNGVNGPWTQVF